MNAASSISESLKECARPAVNAIRPMAASATPHELIPTRDSLLSRLKDWQDDVSWRDFFNTYWRLVYGVALKAGLNEQEAQEVVQETVITVARRIPEFKYNPNVCSFKTWLLNLTRWRIVDQLRKRQPGSAALRSHDGGPLEQVADPAGLDLDAVWAKEWHAHLLQAAIRAVKRKVNPEQYQIFHLCVFAVLAGLLLFSLTHGAQFARITDAMRRLEGTSAQIGVRGDFALIAVVAGVASQLGLETILAAFTVGVIRGMTSSHAEREEERLDAVTLGIFIPFFFVNSGLQFDLGALFSSVSSFIRLPLFLLAVLIVRALPALLYRSRFATRRTAAAGLLQATSLSFIVVATQIALMLNIMYPATATALVGAGLITVMVFPALAFALIGEREGPGETPDLEVGLTPD